MRRFNYVQKTPSNSRFLSRYPQENKRIKVKNEVIDHSFKQLILIASNPCLQFQKRNL